MLGLDAPQQPSLTRATLITSMSEGPTTLAQQTEAEASPRRWYEWRGSGCILVVDDDTSVRTVVARALSRLGFTANEAPDGQRAIELFEANPGLYTLVIMDLRLPGMDGTAILSMLQRVRPDIPVVLMSGMSHVEALNQFDGQGLAGFLQKPFPLDSELRAVLDA